MAVVVSTSVGLAQLTPREEVLLLRMYNLRYIGMAYTAVGKLESKVEWKEVEQKYEGLGFQASIDRLFHYGLIDDHGKSRQVASLSKTGVDYAFQLKKTNKYPDESGSSFRILKRG
jgi:hypothetical protein